MDGYECCMLELLLIEQNSQVLLTTFLFFLPGKILNFFLLRSELVICSY